MTDSALVKLISTSNPQILVALRNKYPVASSMLGADLKRRARVGTEDDSDLEQSVAVARIDFLGQSIAPLRKELDAILSVVVQKMNRIKRTKMFGAVVATLSGLTITISEAFGVGPEWVNVVSAAFATVGGLVVIVSDYFAQAPNGKYIVSAEEYGTLNQMAKELFKLEKRVQRHRLYPLRVEEVAEMTISLEEFATHVNGLTLK